MMFFGRTPPIDWTGVSRRERLRICAKALGVLVGLPALVVLSLIAAGIAVQWAASIIGGN